MLTPENFSLKVLGETYKDRLLNEVEPFWFPRSYDQEFGGFLHCFDSDGTLVDTDKSVWAQGRMAWMLLTMYLSIERRPEWLQWAESALDFLTRYCIDPSDGRMYFHVTREGVPIRKRRYAYSESFTAISFAAHAAATGQARSAEQAWHWFEIFTRIHFEPGAMAPKTTGKRPVIDLGSRMITLATAQEMRKFLGNDPRLTQWIDRCIHELTTLFMKPDIKAVMEVVSPEGAIIDHFNERTLNPGHTIEGGWFVLEEARQRGNDPELIKIGCQMIDWAYVRGWDPEFGGLLYYRDVYDRPVQEYWHNMKFWWPHDEALIATTLAYVLTQDPKYAAMHCEVHNWAFSHFQDQVHGEWFGYLNRDGSPANTLKGSLWKSFFHHPRALWNCARYCGSIAMS